MNLLVISKKRNISILIEFLLCIISPSVIFRISSNEYENFQLLTLEMRGTNSPNMLSYLESTLIADKYKRSASQSISIMGLWGTLYSLKTPDMVDLEGP
jgi:hypothetical protein